MDMVRSSTSLVIEAVGECRFPIHKFPSKSMGTPRFSWVFLRHRRPGFVRVEAFHLLEFIKSSEPEVLFINHAVLTDDKSSHAGYVVLSGRGNEGKPADHNAFDEKVHFAQRRGGTLPL